MPIVPIPEWKPDISDYESSTTRNVLNVVPRADGYGPFPDILSISQSLGDDCRGAFEAVKTDGSFVIFAATATDLYVLDNSNMSWTKVSKDGVSYISVLPTDQWRFRQFNNLVIAVQANTVPQVYDIVSSTAFADLNGNPPQARYIDIIGRFAVLTGLPSNPNRVQWSGLNDVNGPDSWTSGINSSDFQDFPDGGVVRGVAGGESGGVVLQDTAIRRMTYVPGSPVIFQIDRIAEDLGIYAPGSLIRAGERVFFYSTKGFYRIDPGSYPAPIGRERVDRSFFVDLDKDNLQLFMGAADPRNTRVFWAYKSVNGSVGQFDKLLCYDWALDRFTPLEISGGYLLPVGQPGATLDDLDDDAASLDAVTMSLDYSPIASSPELGVITVDRKIGFFRGRSLEATIETAEQGTDGRRFKVRGFRPITDAQTVYGSVSKRENQRDTPTYTSEGALNVVGRCNMLASTRYARARCRIPAGTQWSYIAGVEPDFVLEGKR